MNDPRAPGHRWFGPALAAALAPMLAGIGVYAAWVATDWEGWIEAGLWVLASGVAITFVVLLLVVTGRWSARRAIVLAVVSLANYPVAAAVAVLAVSRATRYDVELRNEADTPWREVRLVGGGVDVSLGTIEGGGSCTRSLRFESDGQLELRVAGAEAVVVEGYVTINQGGELDILRQANGELRFASRDR